MSSASCSTQPGLREVLRELAVRPRARRAVLVDGERAHAGRAGVDRDHDGHGPSSDVGVLGGAARPARRARRRARGPSATAEVEAQRPAAPPARRADGVSGLRPPIVVDVEPLAASRRTRTRRGRRVKKPQEHSRRRWSVSTTKSRWRAASSHVPAAVARRPRARPRDRVLVRRRRLRGRRAGGRSAASERIRRRRPPSAQFPHRIPVPAARREAG